MMQINLTGLDNVRAALAAFPKKAKYAAVKAMNTSMEWAQTDVRKEMRRVFDRPTPWVLNSLRIKYAKPDTMAAELAYKDVWSKNTTGPESSRTMIEPHVLGGQRDFKTMEVRLLRIGLLPSGYNVVPGAAAKLDAYGNMGRGQISQLLNVLGAYTEAGYNKANNKTVKRLAKGNAKKGINGFEYIVVKVRSPMARRLHPGVYQRVATGFGSSLKPILMFISRATYRPRLDFYGITKRVIDQRFPAEFDRAFAAEMNRTAGPMSG